MAYKKQTVIRLIWTKCSKNSNIVKYINILFQNVIYSCYGKAEFWALPQASVTHDPSDIILIYWFTAQDTLLLY